MHTTETPKNEKKGTTLAQSSGEHNEDDALKSGGRVDEYGRVILKDIRQYLHMVPATLTPLTGEHAGAHKSSDAVCWDRGSTGTSTMLETCKALQNNHNKR